jgi:hypothetical protein
MGTQTRVFTPRLNAGMRCLIEATWWSRRTGVAERRQAAALRERHVMRACELAVDADFAEADQDAAAGGGDAEAEFGRETREHHDLIELVVDRGVIGASENGVRDDLALGVESGFDGEDAGAADRAGVDSGNLERGEAFEARGLDEMERQVVGNDAAHRHADENILEDQNKRYERGEHASGSRHGNGSQDIFKSENRARPDALQHGDARLHARSFQADAKREIGRNGSRGDAREANGKTAIVFEFGEAFTAIHNVPADSRVGQGRNRTVKITGKLVFGLSAIHLRPPCAFAVRNMGPVATAGEGSKLAAFAEAVWAAMESRADSASAAFETRAAA